MIKELQISSTSIFLGGLTLKGDVTLSNPNDSLAITFEIQPMINETVNKQAFKKSKLYDLLTIFPQSGLLLRNQCQRITVKAKNKDESQLNNLFETNVKLCLKYHLDNNFNRILIKNNKIRNLTIDELHKYEGVFTIMIEVGTDHVRVKDQIQNEVLFRSSLAGNIDNLSQIESHDKQTQNQKSTEDQDCSDVCTLLSSLDLNSKLKAKQSKLSSLKSSPKKEPMLQALDSPVQKLQLAQQSRQYLNQSVLGLESAQEKSFSNHTRQFEDLQPQSFTQYSQSRIKSFNKVSSFEILVLAILAGICFSLGSNFSILLQSL